MPVIKLKLRALKLKLQLNIPSSNALIFSFSILQSLINIRFYESEMLSIRLLLIQDYRLYNLSAYKQLKPIVH